MSVQVWTGYLILYEYSCIILYEYVIGVQPDDDPCGQTQPCQNGGICVHTGAGQYQCVCSEEYEGENCTLARTATPIPAMVEENVL